MGHIFCPIFSKFGKRKGKKTNQQKLAGSTNQCRHKVQSKIIWKELITIKIVALFKSKLSVNINN
jgi:hypothetical protein